MEDVGRFYGHLVYFTATWQTLWTFGIFCGNLRHFSRLGMLYQEKSGNLCRPSEADFSYIFSAEN
jgi:hypothetical protein